MFYSTNDYINIIFMEDDKMTLANFNEIMINIIGAPTNDYEQFVIFTLSALLGMTIILFVFYLFYLVITLFKPKRI